MRFPLSTFTFHFDLRPRTIKHAQNPEKPWLSANWKAIFTESGKRPRISANYGPLYVARQRHFRLNAPKIQQRRPRRFKTPKTPIFRAFHPDTSR